MDSLLKFAADNQVLLIIIAVILVLALIGYLTESKKFHDEDKAAQIRGVNQPSVDEVKSGVENANVSINSAVSKVDTVVGDIHQEEAKSAEEEKAEVL